MTIYPIRLISSFVLIVDGDTWRVNFDWEFEEDRWLVNVAELKADAVRQYFFRTIFYPTLKDAEEFLKRTLIDPPKPESKQPERVKQPAIVQEPPRKRGGSNTRDTIVDILKKNGPSNLHQIVAAYQIIYPGSEYEVVSKRIAVMIWDMKDKGRVVADKQIGRRNNTYHLQPVVE